MFYRYQSGLRGLITGRSQKSANQTHASIVGHPPTHSILIYVTCGRQSSIHSHTSKSSPLIPESVRMQQWGPKPWVTRKDVTKLLIRAGVAHPDFVRFWQIIKFHCHVLIFYSFLPKRRYRCGSIFKKFSTYTTNILTCCPPVEDSSSSKKKKKKQV